MPRRRVMLMLKALTSLVFGWILLQVARSPGFAEALAGVDPRFVAASLALSAAMVSASCLKWSVLLRARGHRPGFLTLLRFYLIGYYFTCLLPSNIGGDVARSFYAGRTVGSQSDAAVSVLLERVTGLAVLLVLILICPFGVEGLMSHPAVWIPALGGVGLLVLMVVLVRVRQPLARLQAWVGDTPGLPGRDRWMRILEAVRTRLLGFHRKLAIAVRELRHRPSVAWPVFGLTLLFYALCWVNVYVSFRAFGHEVPIRSIVAILPTAMVVAMLPVAPLAGLGLAEGAYVFYFGLVSVAGGNALAMGLLLRCKLLLLGSLGWLAHLTLPDRMPAGEVIRPDGLAETSHDG